MHKNDRIRLIISHNNLDKPLSTKLIKVNDLDVSKVSSIGNTVEYKEFSLEEAEKEKYSGNKGQRCMFTKVSRCGDDLF